MASPPKSWRRFIWLPLHPPTMPAETSYILGPDWKPHIIVTTSNNPNHKEWSYISIPNDPVNEADHCFRMRRCGAIRESLPSFGPQSPSEPLNKQMKGQIMGWPSDGGVWYFRKALFPPVILGKSRTNRFSKTWEGLCQQTSEETCTRNKCCLSIVYVSSPTWMGFVSFEGGRRGLL